MGLKYMEKSKKSFKLKTIIIITAVFLILLIIGAVIALKMTLISKDEAMKAALDDAGLNKSDVSGLYAELDFDHNRFQYEVDFYSDGIEYEYNILAKNGEIISRDIDNDGMHKLPLQDSGSPAETQSQNKINNENAQNSNSDISSSQSGNKISVDDAKSIALSDAGLNDSDVTFIKSQLDNDDFIDVYDIEFYTKDKEYEYEINAADGAIVERNIGTYHRHSNNNSSDQYIGSEKAKEIALDHAGISEKDIKFFKSELKNDEIPEYEISFYNNNIEYDYDIDALTGDVLEYDTDINH